MISTTWRALVSELIDGVAWAETDAPSCFRAMRACGRAKALLAHTLLALELQAEWTSLRREAPQPAPAPSTLCLPFDACSRTSHGEQDGGSLDTPQHLRFPTSASALSLLCLPVREWAAATCGAHVSRAFERARMQHDAAPALASAASATKPPRPACDSPGARVPEELCGLNVSSAFWTALSRVVGKEPVAVRAAAIGAWPPSASSTSHAPTDEPKQVQREAYLEADRLVHGGSAELKYRLVRREFWAALPGCDTRGRTRLWC